MHKAVFGSGTRFEFSHSLFHSRCFVVYFRLHVARDFQVVVICGDFFQRDYPSDAIHILKISIPSVVAPHVFGKQFIVRTAGFELLGSVDYEHFVLSVLVLSLTKHEDAGSQGVPVEEIRPQPYDGFQHVHAEDLLTNLAFGPHAEERTVRQYYDHAARLRSHRPDQMLHPSMVPTLSRRHPCEIPSIGIACPDFLTPLFQREGRIGDHAVERGEVITGEKGWLAPGVPAHDLKVRSAVQEKVHPCNRTGGEVLLLSEELSLECAVSTVILLHVVDCFQEHATRATGRVVNGLALLRVEDIHQEPHDRTRCLELARLLVRGIGKLLDKLLVRLSEDVDLGCLVAQVDTREVLHEVPEQ
jgi:hypothetical protein